VFSLRGFHFLFLIVAIIAADLFGAWGVWNYRHSGDVLQLAAGVLSFLFGFALIGYALWLVRKLDQARIQ
jgi:hypothetical protein